VVYFFYICAYDMAETPNLLNISVETANTRRYSSSWPSSKRTRSRTCVVSACARGDYNLCKWKETFCKDHKTLFGNDNCTCKPPYELFTIPSRKKEARVVWKKLINRKKGDGNQMWSPGQKSRVCSHHFIDKRPTESNPYPVLKLGYDASSKIDNIPIITGQSRKRKLLHAITSVKNPKQSKQTKLFPSENGEILNVSILSNESNINETTEYNLLSPDNNYFSSPPSTPVVAGQQRNRINTDFNSPPYTPVVAGQQRNRINTDFNAPQSTPVVAGQQRNRINTNFNSPPSTPVVAGQQRNRKNADSLNLKSFVVLRRNKYYEYIYAVMVTISSILAYTGLWIDYYKKQLKNANYIILILKNKNDLLSSQISNLKKEYKKLSKQKKECRCCKPLHVQLLDNDKNVKFYTGIDSVEIFKSVHDIIAPFVRQRWRGISNTATALKRKYKILPKRMGPVRKLDSKDEFLMLLMRLRLGLMVKDLAKRFNVSVTLASNIINSWLRCSAQVLKSFVFVPDQGTLNITSPAQFKDIHNLHSIIDCTEVFIQTPKDHKLQKITWSNYKHHNTMKILVSVSSNSTIIFVSKAYSGNISDKEIVKRSKYLDLVEPYSKLMVDKGFPILEECTARNIELLIPPGKRGKTQMTTIELKRTKKIACKRIIVEQVISQLKNFKIIANEMALTTVCQLDDMLIICSALVNMMKPIY